MAERTITQKCGHKLTHDFRPTDWTIKTYGDGLQEWADTKERTSIDYAASQLCADCAAQQTAEIARSRGMVWDARAGAYLTPRLAAQPVVISLVRADCGHEVSRTQIMRASLGTSCPDCYDRMSA